MCWQNPEYRTCLLASKTAVADRFHGRGFCGVEPLCFSPSSWGQQIRPTDEYLRQTTGGDRLFCGGSVYQITCPWGRGLSDKIHVRPQLYACCRAICRNKFDYRRQVSTRPSQPLPASGFGAGGSIVASLGRRLTVSKVVRPSSGDFAVPRLSTRQIPTPDRFDTDMLQSPTPYSAQSNPV